MLYKVIYSLFFILLISSCGKGDNSEITEIEINKILTGGIYSIELNEEEIKTQLQIDLEKITSDQIKEDKRIDDIVNKEIADKKLKEKKELEKYILADKKREELELLEIKMQVELTQERKIQELEKRALEYKK